MEREQLFQLPVLRSRYRDLTKAERRIADYIVENEKQIMAQTIADIAEQTRSSEITVSRFCKKLGFNGLQSLKIALAGDLGMAEESGPGDVGRNDSYEAAAGKLFHNINDGLQDTLKLLDFNAVERAIELLLGARTLSIYGFGNSAIVARDIEMRFMRLGLLVHAYDDAHMQVASAALLSEKDVVLAVSHTGTTLELLQSVAIAKGNSVPVIAITSYVNSPLARQADLVLHGMGRELSVCSEAAASRLIHLAIADVLYTGISWKNRELHMKRIDRLHQALGEKRK